MLVLLCIFLFSLKLIINNTYIDKYIIYYTPRFRGRGSNPKPRGRKHCTLRHRANQKLYMEHYYSAFSIMKINIGTFNNNYEFSLYGFQKKLKLSLDNYQNIITVYCQNTVSILFSSSNFSLSTIIIFIKMYKNSVDLESPRGF